MNSGEPLVLYVLLSRRVALWQRAAPSVLFAYELYGVCDDVARGALVRDGDRALFAGVELEDADRGESTGVRWSELLVHAHEARLARPLDGHGDLGVTAR